MLVLTEQEWRERRDAHRERVAEWTSPHRQRQHQHRKHPVLDFLFTYYSFRPARLERWQPGVDVALVNGQEFLSRKGFTETPHGVALDPAALTEKRRGSAEFILGLLSATASRPARLGCFGLHEWAMVYRQREHRHGVPLRLGEAATDAVVEAHELRCTHIDAYRFFTPDAVPRNRFAPTREAQAELEQPGCLHAGMDVYKWAVKLGPLVPGEVLLDAFELARDIRYLDMQASPYDMEPWGGRPVRIETAEGKAEYVRRQRAFAERSNVLRHRVLEAAFRSTSNE